MYVDDIMALFANHKANKNYVKLPLAELLKKHKAMDKQKRKKYTRRSTDAYKFEKKLLGTGPMGPIFMINPRKLLSTAPVLPNKEFRKIITHTKGGKGGSLPNRLRPKPDMRNKRAKRAKAYGYVNAQNNMVLLGKKFDPYGVAWRISL